MNKIQRTLRDINHSKVTKRFCKRAFDVAVGVVGLSAMACVAVRYRRQLTKETGESLFVCQRDRVGRNGETFGLWKFRTMNEERDSEGNLLSEDERLGTLGDKLRRRGLDETANAINILLGNIHAVGYRSHLLTDFIAAHQERHHDKRPGLINEFKLKNHNANHSLELEADLEARKREDQRGAWQTLCYDTHVCFEAFKHARQGGRKDAETSYYVENTPEQVQAVARKPAA